MCAAHCGRLGASPSIPCLSVYRGVVVTLWESGVGVVERLAAPPPQRAASRAKAPACSPKGDSGTHRILGRFRPALRLSGRKQCGQVWPCNGVDLRQGAVTATEWTNPN